MQDKKTESFKEEEKIIIMFLIRKIKKVIDSLIKKIKMKKENKSKIKGKE